VLGENIRLNLKQEIRVKVIVAVVTATVAVGTMGCGPKSESTEQPAVAPSQSAPSGTAGNPSGAGVAPSMERAPTQAAPQAAPVTQ
jgi:hypothetical protein